MQEIIFIQDATGKMAQSCSFTYIGIWLILQHILYIFWTIKTNRQPYNNHNTEQIISIIILQIIA